MNFTLFNYAFAKLIFLFNKLKKQSKEAKACMKNVDQKQAAKADKLFIETFEDSDEDDKN